MWPNCAKLLSTLAQIQNWFNKPVVKVYNPPAPKKVLLVQMFTDNSGRTCWTEIYLDNFSAADFHTTQSSLLVCGTQCLTTDKYVNCSILVMNTPPDFVQKLWQTGLLSIIFWSMCKAGTRSCPLSICIPLIRFPWHGRNAHLATWRK